MLQASWSRNARGACGLPLSEVRAHVGWSRWPRERLFFPEIGRGGVLSPFSLLPSCNHFLATFVGSTRSPSRPDGSRDLDEERQMRSNVSERFAFGAHPRSRAHADTRAQRRADLRWTDCSDRVLCCAAPCAVRASTAQIARSRRDQESPSTQSRHEAFLWRAPGVAPTRARGSRPRRLALDGLCRSGVPELSPPH